MSNLGSSSCCRGNGSSGGCRGGGERLRLRWGRLSWRGGFYVVIEVWDRVVVVVVSLVSELLLVNHLGLVVVTVVFLLINTCGRGEVTNIK